MSISSIPGGDGNYTQASSVTNTVEREANARIAAAGKRVEAAQEQVNENINAIRDSYDRDYTAINTRNQEALEALKNKGYGEIRQLQRSQQTELRRQENLGERDLSKEKQFYANSTYDLEKRNREHQIELQSENLKKIEYEQNANNLELEDLKARQRQLIARLQENSEDQLQHASDATAKRVQIIKEGYEQSIQGTQEKFMQDFEKIHSKASQTINALNEEVSEQIRNIRQDTAQKLSAYQSRQSDPFYKLMDIQASLADTGDAFELTATIPEYEQQHISVSIQGNNVIILGNRKNEENLTLGPGRAVGSASFQTFHESFPLSWPVEANRLTKEFDGDRLTIRIPKKNEYAFKEPTQPQPAKTRAESPQFPKNISHVKTKELGSNTLT